MKRCCKSLKSVVGNILMHIPYCLDKGTPTVRTVRYAVPYHTELLFKSLRLGVGVNTMQGHEAKHIHISDYTEHSTRKTRWKLVMRHDFILNVWLRKHNPLKSSYKKCKDVYERPEMNMPGFCKCGLEIDSNLNPHSCSICSSDLYKYVATAESGELDKYIKDLLSKML